MRYTLVREIYRKGVGRYGVVVNHLEEVEIEISKNSYLIMKNGFNDREIWLFDWVEFVFVNVPNPMARREWDSFDYQMLNVLDIVLPVDFKDAFNL